MKAQEELLDIRLNALADGELDTEQSEELLGRLESDAGLQARLCDIHRIKDMVHYAYPEESGERPPHERGKPRRPLVAIAASVLFALGLLVGQQWQQRALEPTLITLDQLPASEKHKVVLYINQSSEARFRVALQQAESLLAAGGGPTEVNLVASAGGIDLLRRDASPFAKEIADLARRYQGVSFVACNKSLANRKTRGLPVDLLDEAEVANSAVQFIVRRMQQGWSYVEI